jgi:hypothetical protein
MSKRRSGGGGGLFARLTGHAPGTLPRGPARNPTAAKRRGAGGLHVEVFNPRTGARKVVLVRSREVLERMSARNLSRSWSPRIWGTPAALQAFGARYVDEGRWFIADHSGRREGWYAYER